MYYGRGDRTFLLAGQIWALFLLRASRVKYLQSREFLLGQLFLLRSYFCLLGEKWTIFDNFSMNLRKKIKFKGRKNKFKGCSSAMSASCSLTYNEFVYKKHWEVQENVYQKNIFLIVGQPVPGLKRTQTNTLQTLRYCQDTRGRFHQHSMSSFYARRSQKRKKSCLTWLSFLHFWDLRPAFALVERWWNWPQEFTPKQRTSSRKSRKEKEEPPAPAPVVVEAPAEEKPPTVAEVCENFGLADVELDYSEADVNNLTTYKLFQHNFRQQIQAANPKVWIEIWINCFWCWSYETENPVKLQKKWLFCNNKLDCWLIRKYYKWTIA